MKGRRSADLASLGLVAKAEVFNHRTIPYSPVPHLCGAQHVLKTSEIPLTLDC